MSRRRRCSTAWANRSPPRAAGTIRNRSRARPARWPMSDSERVNQVLRYDFSKGFTRSRGEVVPLPPAARKLPINKGLEALVFVPRTMASLSRWPAR